MDLLYKIVHFIGVMVFMWVTYKKGFFIGDKYGSVLKLIVAVLIGLNLFVSIKGLLDYYYIRKAKKGD